MFSASCEEETMTPADGSLSLGAQPAGFFTAYGQIARDAAAGRIDYNIVSPGPPYPNSEPMTHLSLRDCVMVSVPPTA